MEELVMLEECPVCRGAGMIMHEAWEEVAYTGETTLYKEMQTTVNEMKNGVSEIDAMFNFGSRCIYSWLWFRL